MKAYLLFATAALVYFQSVYASLVVKGPANLVLEGDDVTLECLDSEPESNMTQVHFERYSKHMLKWYRLEADEMYLYRRCFFYDVDVRREAGRLRLMISSIQTWSEGPYRCVAENATGTDNSSMPLSVPVHYMRPLSVYREGSFSRYFSSLQHLRVPLGDDVELECSTTSSETPEYTWQKEGEDWMVPSSKLRLEQVRSLDEGKYTCTARHPSVDSLTKTRTISITVLPGRPWYESTNGRIALMTSAAGAGLLVIALSMTAYLCRRANQRKSKGPIDDRSQKKPIYTASVDSLPSITGDKQPLV